METLLMGQRCCYVLCLIFIYYSQQSSCATIEVGGPVGWTNYDTSTNKPPDYATWVSSQSVVVDDILVFKFPPEYHNVYLLPTQAAYTSCDQSKATELNDGKTGSYSVVEGLGSHCQGARNWRWWLRVAKLLHLLLFQLLHQQKKPLHLLQAVLRLQHLCSECQHQLLLLVHL
ncbi:hypothetical protein BDL97_04G074200 [Sphagnum fallax]|nr:hypothetical protein BDL97_05G105400 [Sphagnum fallax]KAH8964559.1 hypothetical protein BDL97_04G074200 [Sphagnum fallax]